MARKHFDDSFGATDPENYQRFFVPVIGKSLAEDLLRKAALKAGNGYSMPGAAPVWSPGLQRRRWVARVR
jgi:hypothetical protein